MNRADFTPLLNDEVVTDTIAPFPANVIRVSRTASNVFVEIVDGGQGPVNICLDREETKRLRRILKESLKAIES